MGCSSVDDARCPPPTTGETVSVVELGWHVEVALPADELGPELGFLRGVFPGARSLMFGYGKKTFFTAPPDDIGEYFLGPIPGPAVVHVMGLNVTAAAAYPVGTIVLALPPGGAKALSRFIAAELTKDVSGKPVVVAHTTDPAGLFYAAASEYHLFHTCNTWVADALHAAGLPISGDGVVFSGQAVSRAEDKAASQCPNSR
jgi:hypothetical protein